MQYKKLMVFFSVALPFSVLLRFFGLKFIIDPKNGFFTTDNQILGTVTTVLFFVIALLVCIFSFTTHRSPENPPQQNIYLQGFSVILAIVILAETFFVKAPIGTAQMLVVFKMISAICAVVFLAFFAFEEFLPFKMPLICYLFPCLYIILKTITEFTHISSTALITDNIMVLAGYCSVMMFFLQFAKLYNNSDPEKNFRKLLASGLCSVFFCLTQSVAYFIYNLTAGFENLHTTISVNSELLASGLFIGAFLISHFSKKNACDK